MQVLVGRFSSCQTCICTHTYTERTLAQYILAASVRHTRSSIYIIARDYIALFNGQLKGHCLLNDDAPQSLEALEVI